MLVCQTGRDPAMLVPILERPDAEGAVGVAAVTLSDWTDGSDPYAAASALLEPAGRYAISDSGVGDARARPAAGAARSRATSR